MPRTAYDCPSHTSFPWLTGKVTLNLKTAEWLNTSPKFDLMGPATKQTLTLGFCTKIDDLLEEGDYERQMDWPNGSFCIYQVTTECPTGTELNMLSDLHLQYKSNSYIPGKK